jgi:hypothetical protein
MIDDRRKSRSEGDPCVRFGSLSSAGEGVRVGSLGVTVNDTLDGRVDTQGSKGNAQEDLIAEATTISLAVSRSTDWNRQ